MSLVSVLMSPRGLALDCYLARYTGVSVLNHVFAHTASFEARPAVVVCTQGRKTGRWYQVCLPYFQIGDEIMVVGSRGGMPEDPHWAKNLRANLAGEIYLNRKLHKVDARFAEGEEYEELWQLASSKVPTYSEYKQRCQGQRLIPLILLKITS
jgi:deazaflavin-dependent oxidoreductase (nitroreductase family)